MLQGHSLALSLSKFYYICFLTDNRHACGEKYVCVDRRTHLVCSSNSSTKISVKKNDKSVIVWLKRQSLWKWYFTYHFITWQMIWYTCLNPTIKRHVIQYNSYIHRHKNHGVPTLGMKWASRYSTALNINKLSDRHIVIPTYRELIRIR